MAVTRCTDRYCEATPPNVRTASTALRFAVVAFVCNGTSSGGPLAELQLSRAIRLRRVLRRLRSEVDTVAVTHGFDPASVSALSRVGWVVRDVSSSVDHTRLIRPIGSIAAGKAGKHWPRVLRRTQLTVPPIIERSIVQSTDIFALKSVQKNATASFGLEKNYLGGNAFSSWAKFWELPRHADPAAHACGTLPLLAWNMSAYDRVLVVSLDDACPLEDPLPWMQQHADHYLIGGTDRADDFSAPPPRRAWDGIDDRVTILAALLKRWPYDQYTM